MDIADRAEREYENNLALALRGAHVTRPLPAVGACYYCGEDVRSDLRFCDVTCRDDYDYEHAARVRGGN